MTTPRTKHLGWILIAGLAPVCAASTVEPPQILRVVVDEHAPR